MKPPLPCSQKSKKLPKYVLSIYSYSKDFEKYEKRAASAKIKAVRDVLTLPMYAELTVEDVDRICDVILK